MGGCWDSPDRTSARTAAAATAAAASTRRRHRRRSIGVAIRCSSSSSSSNNNSNNSNNSSTGEAATTIGPNPTGSEWNKKKRPKTETCSSSFFLWPISLQKLSEIEIGFIAIFIYIFFKKGNMVDRNRKERATLPRRREGHLLDTRPVERRLAAAGPASRQGNGAATLGVDPPPPTPPHPAQAAAAQTPVVPRFSPHLFFLGGGGVPTHLEASRRPVLFPFFGRLWWLWWLWLWLLLRL